MRGYGHLSAFESGLDGAAQLPWMKCVFAQQHPQVEVVLHAGVGHAQQAHGVELFGHHRVFRVSAQLWSGQVVQQYPVADRFRRRRYGIAKSDVHLQRDARAVELGQEVDPHPAVASLLADFRSLDRVGSNAIPSSTGIRQISRKVATAESMSSGPKPSKSASRVGRCGGHTRSKTAGSP